MKAVNNRGFLLMEALILILILSITFVSLMGVILQTLKISFRTKVITEGLTRYETLLFELENGLRTDLATYGGRGDLQNGYSYDIQNKEERDAYGLLTSQLMWKQGKESLHFNFFVSQGDLSP